MSKPRVQINRLTWNIAAENRLVDIRYDYIKVQNILDNGLLSGPVGRLKFYILDEVEKYN